MEKNLRILVIAPSAYLLGGVQNWLDYLLPGLEKLGHHVILGLPDGTVHRADRYLSVHPWHRVVLIRNATGSRQGRVDAILQVVQQVKPDVVVSVNIADCLEAIMKLRVSKSSSARLIITIHSIEADYIRDLEHYRSVVDGVIYTNKLIGPLIQTIVNFDSSRLFYSPYGVDEGIKSENDNRKPRRVLWLGRMENNQKRCFELPLIVEGLVARDEDFTLVLVGDGPDADELQRKLGKNYARWIEWYGHVSHQEVLKTVLPEAGVLLVNSDWETGPITIWEAMAAGIPVVSSRYTGSGEEQSLVHNHNAMMFDVGNVDAAVECLSRTIEDENLRCRLISNGHELVRAKYTTSVSVKSWHDSILTVLELPSKGEVDEDLIENRSSGRLDRWFGPVLGETVRRKLGRTWKHCSAGSEWPHARHGVSVGGHKEFMKIARALDQQARKTGHFDSRGT